MTGKILSVITKILLILLVASLASCALYVAPPGSPDNPDNPEPDDPDPENPDPENPDPGDTNKGKLSACFFIADYNQVSVTKAAKIRLSIKGSGNTFTEFKTLAVDPAGITAVQDQGAPPAMPGGIWTGAFDSLASGSYGAGSLKMELLDAASAVLSTAYNDETLVISTGKTTSGVFFIVPASLPKSGTLKTGEIEFCKISLAGGQSRVLTLTASGSWPDIALFNSNGTFFKYYSVSNSAGAEITLNPPAAVSYYAGVYADSGEVSTYTLDLKLPGGGQEEGESVIYENFENFSSIPSPWTGSSTVTITNRITEQPANPYFGNETKFVKLPRVSGGGTTYIQRSVSLSADSAMSFIFKTENDASINQIFNVKVDGVIKGTWSGTDSIWRSESVLVPSGTHTLRFEFVSSTTAISGGLNAAYIDDVSIAPDVTDSIVIYPRGNLSTAVGVSPDEKIKFNARALRCDGSVRKNASGFVYSGSGVDPVTGLFTPVAAGNVQITASLDGKNGIRSVTVHPADYMRQPYYYSGTGKTYNGFSGTAGNTVITAGKLTITYPLETNFSADGFFSLEGSVSSSTVSNYTYIVLTKSSDASLITHYFVKDNFKKRIWLRFGSGAYTVRVYELTSIGFSSELGAEGEINSWSTGNSLTYAVNNTANDGTIGGVPDRRYIYPSYLAPSDDFRISNLVADLTYGLTDDAAKAKAVHDYIICNTVYDTESYNKPARRKKQDALSVLGKRYTLDAQYDPEGHYVAVCEGYSNLNAALLRAAGIEAQYVSSSTINHGWNQAYVNGGWKLIDVTWDDPILNTSITKDLGPTTVFYKNFLQTDLAGGSPVHPGGLPKTDRAVSGGKPLSQRGVPDGWY